MQLYKQLYGKIKFFIFSFIILIFTSTGCNMDNTNQNILVITGGKKFDRENFLRIFNDMDNISYKEAIQPEANNIYSSPEIKNYDAILFYDIGKEINKDQKIALLDLLDNGMGMVFLHHSLVSYQDWNEFEKIIGGRYYQSTNKSDSLKYVQSTFRHDVEIPVHIVDKNHPITRGIDDFVIHDEVYGKYKILPNVSPLITTTHPESEEIIGWTNYYGKSKIVYIQLGHDNHSYADLNYRRLVKQSINWVTTN